jgi:hypothetical protein
MATSSALGRVKFGDFVADFDSFELRKHGIRLKLQDQPFAPWVSMLLVRLAFMPAYQADFGPLWAHLLA